MLDHGRKIKVLFITKKRTAFYGSSFGLLNSATFTANALNDMGMEAKVVAVVDNNGIDKEIHEYRPTHVVIEALWVVPDKFDILLPLHPKVEWIIRIHSNIPFLANEGVAMEWIFAYQKYASKKFTVATNNEHCHTDLQKIGIENAYLPNIYEPNYKELRVEKKKDRDIHIGCFGAIRPMKNHLVQAIAAIKFAESIGKKLYFHINSDRIEQKGENVLKNLRNIFENINHELVEHSWCCHKDFLKLISQMDMGMQVSLSETFNIVSADFVNCGVPISVSPEISWMPCWTKADPTDADSIVKTMSFVWSTRNTKFYRINDIYLNKYNKTAKNIWKDYLNSK